MIISITYNIISTNSLLLIISTNYEREKES